MSLFGTPNNAAPSGSSLFGGSNNNTTPSQQQGGLFGASTNNQPSSGTSLFGGNKLAPLNTASANQSSGLFGNTNTSAPSGGGLFGTSNANTTGNTATGGGLFGAQQNASTQPQSNPLFGAAPATQAPSTSIFGAQSTQPQSNPLFGGQSTQPQNNSLFGAQSTQPQNSSVFGGTTAVQSQPNSLFGQQSTANNALNLAQSTTDGQVARPGDAPRAALFDDLLERGKKRRDTSGDMVQPNQLPSLQLSLGDISSKIRGLGGAKPDFGASRAHDTRAQYLLAASGVPQGATRRDLDTFAARSGTTTQQSATSFDADMENYMNNVHAKTTMELLNESMEQSRRDFDVFIEDNIQINWNEQRRRIYEHFGLVKPTDDLDSTSAAASVGPAERGPFGKSSRRARGLDASGAFGTRSTFGRSSASRSILGGSVQRSSVRQQALFPDVAEKTAGSEQGSALGDAYLRNKQERYIEKVRELNRARVEGLCYPVAHRFANVEFDSAETPQHLKDAYRALTEIVGEPSEIERPSETGALRQRQYAKEYLDESPGSGAGLNIRRRILEGSRKFLENDFYRKVEKAVEENAREADIGGMPTKISKVRGYVKIRGNRKDLGTEGSNLQKLGDDYIWVLVFTLLRCGLIKEAAQYVSDNEPAITAMDRHFAAYIQLYSKHDRNIPAKDRMAMNRTYQQRTLQPENSVDPYRMACYKVMGRCELNRKNVEGINQSVDDLIWLYFALAREANRAEETAGEVFGLEEVRQLMEDIGERYFSVGAEGGPNYAVYFLMQVLSGMFEKAVEWLFRYNYIAAVHFAIALDYYGLLRVADFSVGEENLLSFTTREKPQISFGRMIGYYTRDFRLAKAEAAADYLILVCLNEDLPGESGRSHSQMCHEALKELVLETREFALLLGDVRNDGSRIPGAIQQRLSLFAGRGLDENEFLRSLTVQAAATADDSGRTTDAVLLYHLADDFESVVNIVSRALSDALAVDVGEEQMQLQPLKPRTKAEEAARPAADGPASLSLMTTTKPAELAQSMISLYDSNAMALQRIRRETMDTAHLLLMMSAIKEKVVQSRWAEALDAIKELDFLPFEAKGNINSIRFAAQRLNNLPPVVARNVGPLLVWAITACGQQRRVVQTSMYEGTRNALVEQLATSARDMMVYAGLIRYKLSSDVFEMLARAGQEIPGVSSA